MAETVQRFKRAFGSILLRMHLRALPLSKHNVVLKAFAKSQTDVRFVQIGANDGITNDPLNYFIVTHGWRGILVEPLKHLFERLQHTYAGCQGLIFENAAIASEEGSRAFYYVPESPQPGNELPPWYGELGSLSREVVLSHANEYPAIKRELATEQVTCISFETLCTRHRMQAPDVIAIDAEGHDFEILALIAFERYRPLLLIYEHHHMSVAERASCRERLSHYGYQFVEEVLNTICLNVERLTPRHRLLREAWHTLTAVGAPG